MIYLIVPMAVWGLTLALLRYGRGQRGFDLFFRHFAVQASAGVVGYVLYKLEVAGLGFPIFMGWVGLHSLLLFLYACATALGRRLGGGMVSEV